ncbi:expressed unknown protein [Seminavis robusta]|uniref:Uncharacterized protein n=1 Tax=Seminavis robusta TaxID=568900 RepID=A0A9N8H7L2_9STRA|nr:expressed unknown protein [Seminavis robusta]|eukprot:Sro184_g079880.1 n/a (910) ;mRNA; r:30190-32919
MTSFNDEAALVDSFFLPGGILDPDQEEDQEEAAAAAETRKPPYPPGIGPPTTTTPYQWTDAPPLAQTQTQTQPTLTYLAPETEEMREEEPNSFWSTNNAASNNMPFDPSPQPFATTNTPQPWMLPATVEETFQTITANNQEEDPNNNLLHNPGLFPYGNTLQQSNSQNSDLVAQLPRCAPDHDPLQHLKALQFTTTPLPGPLGITTIDVTTTSGPQKPLPSAQEVEDVRKMVSVLSSSLRNIVGTSDHALPEHLLRPDSPPKIIRRPSSLTHHRINLPLELPDEQQQPAAPNHEVHHDDDDNDFLIDHQSTTSSLSSGSAKRDDSHRSHSSVPLSVHYQPSETSFLVQQQPTKTFLPETDGPLLFPPSQPTLPLTEKQQRPLLSTFAAVAPPPGYQHLPPPQRYRFEDEEPKPAPIPSPLPHSKALVPSHEEGEDMPEEDEEEVPEEENIWQQVVPKEPREPPKEQRIAPKSMEPPPVEAKKLLEAAASTSRNRDSNTAGQQKTSTTTTTPTIVADSTVEPTQVVATTSTTSTKKKRSGRKHKSSKRGTAGTGTRNNNREPQLHQNDVLKTGKTPVVVEEAPPPRESPTRTTVPSTGTAITRPVTTTTKTSKTKPITHTTIAGATASTTRTTARTTTSMNTMTSVLVCIDNSMDFARRCTQFQMSLLSRMIQEAVKEAVERQSIAGCYAAIYFTPVICDLIMDQCVWLPHFFPGITLGIVLTLICRAMLKDQYLIEMASFSPAQFAVPPPQQQGEKVGRGASTKKKTQKATPKVQLHDISAVTLSQKEYRLQELRSMEAKICIRLLRSLRWVLPTVVLAAAMVDRTFEEDIVPALRLVAAFGLSMLQTINLFSPLAWTSASMQVLVALTMQNSHPYMERWFGVEVLVGSLGLSTLRFLRLSAGARQKYL